MNFYVIFMGLMSPSTLMSSGDGGAGKYKINFIKVIAKF
jgi:hypothetical protein